MAKPKIPHPAPDGEPEPFDFGANVEGAPPSRDGTPTNNTPPPAPSTPPSIPAPDPFDPQALRIHPRQRCTKAFYRSRAWVGSGSHLHLLQKEAVDLPRLLGLPRYYYRICLDHLRSYIGALWGRNESATFFYELKMIRFGGLLWEALRQPGKRHGVAAGGKGGVG
jgi:hypothetical protein